MGRINILDKDTFNKIAAGEVVERPASVVKELVENAIDARTSEIHIEILGGGEDLIRVLDKGEGLMEDDMLKAFMPHATSKIISADDLFRISTMGFRGEALSSISSVSKVMMRSRTEGEDGREIYLEGGELRYEKYAPMDRGTLIEVKDLFYNVPARKKFLKSSSRESGIINETISKISIAYPEIIFTLISEGKPVLKTYGTGNQKDVIRQVYSKKVQESVFYFESHSDSLSIHGYIGNEEISRGTRNQQTIFVNRRLVQSKIITAAVENGFKSFATVNRFPFFIVNLEIYPELIDVNIHPQKAEVKFEDERHIYKAVFDAVHQALSEGLKKTFEVEKEYIAPENFEQLTTKETEGPRYIDIPVDITERSFPTETKEAQKGYGQGSIPSEPLEFSGRVTSEEVMETASLKTSGLESGTADPRDEGKFPMPRIIGQFRSTYILTEIHDELYIFDQHAAHEKINFEKYMDGIMKGFVASQALLIPRVLELSIEDFRLYEENRGVLADAGFIIEEFGDRTVSIREVPYFLGTIEETAYFHDILDNIRNLGKGTREEVKYMRIATVACKASVKAYETLTHKEMEYLIDELRHIREPFTCPHGRPTVIKYTQKDLEKAFRRIV